MNQLVTNQRPAPLPSSRSTGAKGSVPRPLDGAARRIVRQFVEALLFEKIVEFRSEENATGASDSRDPIYDHRFEFEVGTRRYACEGTVSAFDRIRIRPGSVCRRTGELEYEIDVFDLVEALCLGAGRAHQLHEQLSQTTTICRWNKRRWHASRGNRRTLGFDELEQAIHEGHQYHPCFKSRTGFTLRDHERYAAEGGRAFQLHFLAIRKEEVKSTLPTDEHIFWPRELGAERYESLMGDLQHLGKSREDYSLVPAHPYQLRAIQGKGLKAAISEGRVVPLGPHGDLYGATQSLRTLANTSDPTRPNIKLPLDVFCTSCRRNFRRHFVCTAPTMSRWLESIVASDPFLQEGDRVELLSEYAGLLWDPELSGPSTQKAVGEAFALEGQIGVLFRESVVTKLSTGEAAVPFTALAVEEVDERPFVADWLGEYGADAWVARLIDVTVIPLFHLLAHHGVAFEAHAQNLILVHRDGWPERIVLRDFHEDTEFVPDFLREPKKVPDFSAIDPYFATVPDGDGYRMGSTEDLRQLFMDTVYVFNLTEVSFLLHRHGHMTEQRFWQLVKSALSHYSTSQLTDKGRIARLTCERPRIVVESLLKKAIAQGKTLDFFEHEVRNTLANEGP